MTRGGPSGSGETGPGRHPGARTFRSRTGLTLLVVAAVVAAGIVPSSWLPGGVDIYAHLLWTHQVMRCLAAGELPLWAPDLNAGFGSPGIRLYSPLGPVVSGTLGLVFGSAAAGLRAALVLAIAALVLLPRIRRMGSLVGVVVLMGTPFLGDLLVRSAWSQMLALPVAWWLLEGSVTSDGLPDHPVRTGALTALLWTLHAPTAVMTLSLMAVAVLLRLGTKVGLWWGTRCGLVALGLTAWHWLPLVSELRLTAGRQGLTAGIFDITRNWLGASSAHMPQLNVAMSLAALVMAGLTLVVPSDSSSDLPVRRILLVIALALSTALVVPLAALGLPLAWLQFPWRWLTPAGLLLAAPFARQLRRRPVLFLLWLCPLLVLPRVPPVDPPALGTHQAWPGVGSAVAAFGGNPLAVDVIEHRPPWYPELARELKVFGASSRVITEPGAREVEVRRWRPLDRRVAVTTAFPTWVGLRLLRYPGWSVTVDGSPVSSGSRAAVWTLVPSGRHVVRARWRGNPLAGVGLAILAVTVLLVMWGGWGRRRRLESGGVREHSAGPDRLDS